MKKYLITAAIIVMVTALSGCLSTLHPLFTDKELVFDTRLLGRWQAGDGDDTAIFERGTPASFNQLPDALRKLSDKGYLVTIRDDNAVVKYYAFLTSLGKQLYIDYYPCENAQQSKYDGFYKQHLVKMHSFYRIRFNDDRSFETSQFDEDFLKKLIDNKQIRIKYEVRYDGNYVITASTEELQQYVLKYGDVPEAYYKESNSVYKKLP
jgi:DNA-binding PadR family transcriptional regulator